jgi:drug/metabolite transporter (DMT)-like permease
MIYLPLVEATVISFLSPLLTTIASKMVARSTLSLRQIGASCLCFSGVVCITLARTIFNKDQHQEAGSLVTSPAPSLGVLIALVGVIGSSVSIGSLLSLADAALRSSFFSEVRQLIVRRLLFFPSEKSVRERIR